MSVATEKTSETFLNVVAGTPVNLAFPLYNASEVKVVYGKASLTATPNSDYTVQLSSPNFDQFTVTPLAPLIAKINALIVLDATETNYITVRRDMPVLTSADANTVRSNDFMGVEMSRFTMMLQELREKFKRSVVRPERVPGADATQITIDDPVADNVLIYSSDAKRIIPATVASLPGSLDTVITSPQDGDQLKYSASSSAWINTAAPATGEIIKFSELGISASKTAAQNTTLLNNALTAVASKGARFVGDVAEQPRINRIARTGISKLSFEGVPGFRLIGDSFSGTQDRGLLQFSGVTTATTTMSASAAKGATSIQVANPDALTVGKPFRITSSGEKFNGLDSVGGYPNVNKQELRWCDAKSGSTITLDSPLEDSYDASTYTVTITPIDHITDIIFGHGFNSENDQPDDPALTNGIGPVGFYVEYCLRTSFFGHDARQWQNAAAKARLCWDVSFGVGGLLTGVGRDAGVPDDCYYGWNAHGSVGVIWDGIHFKHGRRPADSGVGEIMRRFKQCNIYADGMNGSLGGTHHAQHGEIYAISGRNIVSALATAIAGRARDIRIHSCKDLPGCIQLGTSLTAGIDVKNATVGNVEIEDVSFDLPNGGSYIRSDVNYESLTITGVKGRGATTTPITLRGNKRAKTIIDGNDIDANGQAFGVDFQNNSSALTEDVGISIGVNRFRNVSDSLVRIASATGANKTDKVLVMPQISDRTEKNQLLLSGTNFGPSVVNLQGLFTPGATSGIKNRIHNGDGSVNKRNGLGADVTNATAFTCDRWRLTAGSQTLRSGIITTSLDYGMRQAMTVQTRLVPAGAPGAAVDARYEQVIEGIDWEDLLWGTANAKPITLRIGYRVSVTGTYYFAIQNAAKDRSYVFSLTLQATTWTYIEVTIPGDTAGTWPTGANAAARFVMDMGCGSNFETTPGAWQAGNFTCAAGGQKLTNQAQFNLIRFTEPVLVEGVTAMGIERHPRVIEEAICARYYNTLSVNVPASPAVANIPIDMRAVPVVAGGGSGFASAGTTATMLQVTQTSQAVQTLTLDADLT